MRQLQEGVFEQGKRLHTINLVKGVSVYGERLVKIKGTEYREWNPHRSKLAAMLMKGVRGIKLNPASWVLYLGAATGTTVSHVSDICTKGLIFAVEFSPRVFSELYLLSKRRGNIIPLLADASAPEEYYFRLGAVDFLYQDIAQRDQVGIFIRNCQLFLKKGAQAVLCVKSRSIDVSKKPKNVFAEVKATLSERFRVLDYRTLHPFQRDHALFLVENRKL